MHAFGSRWVREKSKDLFKKMQTLKTTAKSKQATEQTEPLPEQRSSFSLRFLQF